MLLGVPAGSRSFNGAAPAWDDRLLGRLTRERGEGRRCGGAQVRWGARAAARLLLRRLDPRLAAAALVKACVSCSVAALP